MRENKPFVSVITGYYNRKENLKDSVQSVLDQSYENIEYIVFDDCSTDGTREILKGVNHPRLKLILHEENIGFTKGLIAAIHKAKGDFIALHGAGDFSYPKRIETQLTFLKNGGYGMVGCTYQDVYPEKTVIKKSIAYENDFSHGEILFDKNIYLKTGGYNKILYYGQFTQLMLEFQKVSSLGSVDELLYKRIHYNNGTSANKQIKFAQKFFVKSGQFLARDNLSLASYDKNKILESIYFDSIDKNVDRSFFFKYYSGSNFFKMILNFHNKKLIPKIFVLILRKLKNNLL